MEKLNTYLEQFEKKIKFNTLENSKISIASVGWHIDHSLKVIIGVSSFLKTSNPGDYQWKFNKWRFIVFALGSIPRGKAKAPKGVQSYEKITLEELEKQLETVKKLLEEIKTLPKKANFKHPYFDLLDLKQTIRFLELHTKHHLKIVDDILKK